MCIHVASMSCAPASAPRCTSSTSNRPPSRGSRRPDHLYAPAGQSRGALGPRGGGWVGLLDRRGADLHDVWGDVPRDDVPMIMAGEGLSGCVCVV